jgi:hypothetical protein
VANLQALMLPQTSSTPEFEPPIAVETNHRFSKRSPLLRYRVLAVEPLDEFRSLVDIRHANCRYLDARFEAELQI